MTAEFDPLRDEGEDYSRRLQAAGVEAEAIRVPGQIHGFISLFPESVEVEELLDQVAEWLGDRLRGPAA